MAQINRKTVVQVKDAGGNIAYVGSIILGTTYDVPCADVVPSNTPSGGYTSTAIPYALCWWTPALYTYPLMATPSDLSLLGPQVCRANLSSTPAANPYDGSTGAAVTAPYAGVALSATFNRFDTIQVAGPGSICAVLTSTVAIALGATVGNANSSNQVIAAAAGTGIVVGNVVKRNVATGTDANGVGVTSYAIIMVNPI